MTKVRVLSTLLCLILASTSLSRQWTLAQEFEADAGFSNKHRADVTSSGSESNNSILDLDENESESNSLSRSGKQFSYQDHPDDHGIYSGRSLASKKQIKHPNGTYALDDEESTAEKSTRRDENEQSPYSTIDFVEKEWQLMFRSLDAAYDTISSSLIEEIGKQTNLFDQVVSQLPMECKRDIYHIRESAMKHRLWALRMADSNGKIPSGITYGRFSSPGDYEECLGTRVSERIYKGLHRNGSEHLEDHKFHGKYCLIDFRLPLPERPRNKLLSIHESVLNFTGTELERQFPELIHNYSAYASVLYEVGYMHAFCLPSTCDVNDLTKSMTKALEGIYIIVNSTVDCEEWPEQREPLRLSQIISLSIMGFVFANALLASIISYIQNCPKAKEYRQQVAMGDKSTSSEGDRGLSQKLIELAVDSKFYSDCFSIQKNFERLSKPDPRGLTFVHYTRIVAMALTVITHTGALGTLQAITKPADASNSEQIFRDLLPQMLANAFTSIQIFFFMAGFMLVVSTYPAIKRDKGQMSFLEYAIKRAIRLMPGLGTTICLNFIWPLLVDGPMLKYFIRMIVIPCESTWWHTLGFISNFDHVEKMCLRHSYFSASDYQLHIMAFPLLLLLYKQPMLALFLAGLLTISGFIAQVIMVLTKNVLPFMMVDYLDKEAFFNVVHYIHHPVWNHMSAFFYGFIIGYFVVRQIRVNLSAKTIKTIWYIVIPIGTMSIFAPYFWNHYKRPIMRWQMVLYVIFDRFILLSTCAWLSYGSMVLARPPPKKKPESELEREKQSPTKSEDSNSVPVIVQAPDTIQDHKSSKQMVAVFNYEQQTARESPSESSEASPIHLRLKLPGSSMPRQRSFPNLTNESMDQNQQILNQTTLTPNLSSQSLRRLGRTISSSNLATISESVAQKPINQDETKNVLGQIDLVAPKGDNLKPIVPSEQVQKKKKSNAPESNMNTLCLILSRLTFQLYLFNMVVLWIDVNHSKYYWFFSYYFIIVKAAAVYVCSALMAMIFFVVLESPCLTLYIAWVRSRATSNTRIPRPSDD